MDKSVSHGTSTAQSRVDSRRMFMFLVVLALCSAFTFQGWRTLLNNFAVEVAGLSGFEMGIVQSLREVPGFWLWPWYFCFCLYVSIGLQPFP